MEKSSNTNPKGLDKIKKIVVLMFENRSFDHVFGAFPGVNGLMLDGKINENYYNLADPLQPPCASSNPSIYPIPVDPRFPMTRDFTHDFGDGMMPDLFGPIFTVGGVSPPDPGNDEAIYYSGYAQGSPTNQAKPNQKTYPATNSGFYSTYQNNTPQGQEVLTYFEHGALKILPVLAENFVLCDNWHCDMPGHTLPNRAFIHCATTGCVKIDDHDDGQDTSMTIFEKIDQISPGDWKMYAPNAQTENGVVDGQLDTRFLNDNVSSYPGVAIEEFATDCEAGTLPFYSFIMCWLPSGSATPYTDTTMHPNSMMLGGENLLAAVYNTLRNSKSWDETLLVVTFDENGGIYDHVMPPTTTPPLPNKPTIHETDRSSCLNKWKLTSQFDFSLLGLRVPALLISPWLEAGIDSNQYQNTSVTRFVIDTLNTKSPKDVQYLTERDKHAPPLTSVFQQFGTDTKRDDCPAWIEPYAELPMEDPKTGSTKIPYSDGKLGVWIPPGNTAQAAPVPYIQEFLGIYVSPLPGHPDTGAPVTKTFETNADVADYVRQRAEAAERFYASSP